MAIELFSGNNAILVTLTGFGKLMVAIVAYFVALVEGVCMFYMVPIKALVLEKFFVLCAVFGVENVGMLIGDVVVNSGALVICCIVEVLVNIALREGLGVDVG